MALVTLGGITLQTSDSSQQPQVDTWGSLKECVAEIVNGSSQTELKTLAGKFLTSAIDDLNMRHLFRFGRKVQADIALVASQGTYALDADFFAVGEIQLIGSNGDIEQTLEYLPFEQFNIVHPVQTMSGDPEIWYSRNTFDDSQVHVYPVPKEAGKSLRVTIYERIGIPVSDADIIDAPRELGDVICHYGKAQMIYHKDRDRVGLGDRFMRMYMVKKDSFKWSDRREPTATQGFRMPYGSVGGSPFGGFIKI